MTTGFQFDDGSAYERYMGVWSQLVGREFLQWLAPEPERRWLDVGCGNGAFTELIAENCRPRSMTGVDPSEAQLAYARERETVRSADFVLGDAMSLPLSDNSFDVAVMPLVIFFVPNPAVGVAEMTRVVAPGGTVCSYGWDTEDGGFPYDAVRTELAEMGIEVSRPPNPDASSLESLTHLWNDAGLVDVHTTTIVVERTFEDFDDYWTTVKGAPSAGSTLSSLSQSDIASFKARLRERLAPAADGRITCSGRANASKGRVQ
jgi:SAM-dependent methyltransferase